jgi:hypothetical protein
MRYGEVLEPISWSAGLEAMCCTGSGKGMTCSEAGVPTNSTVGRARIRSGVDPAGTSVISELSEITAKSVARSLPRSEDEDADLRADLSVLIALADTDEVVRLRLLRAIQDLGA